MLLSQTQILDEVEQRKLQTQVWEHQALVGNPSLWLFGKAPSSHAGSCRTVFASVCLWIPLPKLCLIDWVSKFNINFDSKRFLLFPRLLTLTFEYVLYLFFDWFKIYIFFCLYPFSAEMHNSIPLLLHKISLSNIIHPFFLWYIK